MTPVQPLRSDRDAGAGGILGITILLLLVAAGLTGGVLVSTLHAVPVSGPQIRQGDLVGARCPADLAVAEGQGADPCRRLEVVNTGQREGTAMCILINDNRGADLRFADNLSFHHSITLGPGQTGHLMTFMDGTPSQHDSMVASCGVPPPS
jgi:hypothetical protein